MHGRHRPCPVIPAKAGIQAAEGNTLPRGAAEAVEEAVGAAEQDVRLDADAAQLALASNIALGALHGLQYSFGFNYAGSIAGAQVGAINYSDTGGSGAQIGLLNVAGSLAGLQVGLINVADDVDGLLSERR